MAEHDISIWRWAAQRIRQRAQGLSAVFREDRRRRPRPLRGLERLEPRQMLEGSGEALLPEGEQASVPMPDFSLIDVNPNSATYNQPVSPRDFLQQVSAFYFTHAT